MTRHSTLPLLVLAIASLPLLGDTCTEKKIVELVIGVPAKATFLAEGIVNEHDETSIIRKSDIDLAAELASVNIDPNELDPDDLAVSRVFYRCAVADPRPDRQIVDGMLTVVELDGQDQPIGSPVVFVSGWTGSFGAVSDFIEITDTIGQPGIDMLNGFLGDCLRNLQDPVGTPPAPFAFRYTVSGQSVPRDVATDFQWELLVQFQAIVPQEFDIPF